jgi:hypothetical protein
MTKASTVTEAVVAVTHGCSESSWSAILSGHDMRDTSGMINCRRKSENIITECLERPIFFRT